MAFYRVNPFSKVAIFLTPLWEDFTAKVPGEVMNEKKKSLLDYVTSFFSFKPKKLVADNVVDEEKDDGRRQKNESYSTDKIQRRKSILNVSEELNLPKKGKKQVQNWHIPS